MENYFVSLNLISISNSMLSKFIIELNKIYDKEVKGYLLSLEGEKALMKMPKDDKSVLYLSKLLSGSLKRSQSISRIAMIYHIIRKLPLRSNSVRYKQAKIND